MNNNMEQEIEICRMSWFLVEIENAPKTYIIIHSVDLVGEDTFNLYIKRKVLFHRDSNTLCGTIMAASDDRKFIENELKKMVNSANHPTGDSRRFLIQYIKGTNNLMHSIVNENDILWQCDQKYQNKEVYVNFNNIQRPATILCIADSEEQTLAELELLKKKCFASVYEDNVDNESPESYQWYLVQYSCGSKDVAYAVINYNETVWRQENLYKNIVLYIRDGTKIYQAIIIKRSNNRDLLDFALSNIKQLCLLIPFPLDPNTHNTSTMMQPNEMNKSGYEKSVPPHSDIDYNLLEIDLNRQQEDDDYDHKKILQKLDIMDLKMQEESLLISNAFKALERVRRGMDQRLLTLDNMLSIL